MTWVVDSAKLEMSNISSNLSELVAGVSCSCKSVTMAGVGKDELLITKSGDYDVAPEDQEEEECQLQEPTAVGQATSKQEAELVASAATDPEVQQPRANLLDLDDEPVKQTAPTPATSFVAPQVMQDLVDLTETKPMAAMPAAEETLLLGDLVGLSMGPVAAAAPDVQLLDFSMTTVPAPDVQLLDLSTTAAPAASPAAPSHHDDLLDFDQSWTEPTTTATASGDIPRLDRLPASSCSMAAPQPCEMGPQTTALLA
eukprot:CAMPEP_0172669568 /NCGR_PEP_ID=MMETSP1074-20121228/9761_1 /TAXON_ID=2916 /ORGANISM="Ceratium fusus, Strain PA161109" /LENGTH=255 /DNA_ID=CAMNT_0013486365 /DNA_START=64 /DNA_END=831 /DNA_ORIENTATION=+